MNTNTEDSAEANWIDLLQQMSENLQRRRVLLDRDEERTFDGVAELLQHTMLSVDDDFSPEQALRIATQAQYYGGAVLWEGSLPECRQLVHLLFANGLVAYMDDGED